MENEDTTSDPVRVSVELSGPYDAVTSKLAAPEASEPTTEPLSQDVHTILETITRLDGGTRSRITEALPEAMNVEYDSELLVELLQVLDAYELVQLDGNTWNPGPRLEGETPRD
jgi:hypothetical protein